MSTGVSTARVRQLAETERRTFAQARPRSLALTEQARATMPQGVPMAWMAEFYDHPTVWVESGRGAHFTDVDGHTYLDFFVGDHSTFCGHAPAPVVRAVTEQVKRGTQFLLPREDAIVVAEQLARRYRLPQWQFTLSATTANVEVLRLARELTGREVVVMFDGKYHGHFDPALVVEEGGRLVPEFRGLTGDVAHHARVVPFNDVAALERSLSPADVALVLAEPAMTNAGFLLPEAGFHDALRELTRASGTLLCLDETHTLVCAYGGLSRLWELEPDLVTLGKSIAGGVPLGAYGMTEPVAALLRGSDAPWAAGTVVGEVATGGTLFANALSMAAARAALTEVLTDEAFTRTGALGDRLGGGLRRLFAALPWSANQVGAHASYFFAPVPPASGARSREVDDAELRSLVRLYLANRGVWESGWWLGPTVSVAHTAADVDTYLGVFEELLSALRSSADPA